MCDYHVIKRASLTIGKYELEVEIILDEDFKTSHDILDGLYEFNRDPMKHPLSNSSPFDYADIAIDNYDGCNEVFFTVTETFYNNEKRYFSLGDNVQYLQKEFSKMGYAKNEAWLRALSSLKKQVRHVQNYFEGLWYFVGIDLTVTQSMTDESGLIWSRKIENSYGSLWGIEWSDFEDNKPTLIDILPQLLPSELAISEDQLNKLAESLMRY